MTRAKIGTLDIETAPIEGNVWGLWDQNVGLNQIKTEWTILSFSFKPLGGTRKDVEYMDTGGRGAKCVRDDKAICKRLWQILDDYDFIIAQNGKRFDLKKIRARLLMHGLPPHSPVQVLDTLLMARDVAAFTSNKLEWLSEKLTTQPKSKHKKFPGFELWVECLKDNVLAWKEMRKYNVADILGTEELYLRLRPWVSNHPNVNVYHDEDDKVLCPRCSSDDVHERGHTHTNVGKYKRYHCQGCGSWSRGRYMVNTPTKRKTLLK